MWRCCETRANLIRRAVYKQVREQTGRLPAQVAGELCSPWDTTPSENAEEMVSTDLFIEKLIDGSEGKQLLMFISWGCGRQGHLLSIGWKCNQGLR